MKKDVLDDLTKELQGQLDLAFESIDKSVTEQIIEDPFRDDNKDQVDTDIIKTSEDKGMTKVFKMPIIKVDDDQINDKSKTRIIEKVEEEDVDRTPTIDELLEEIEALENTQRADRTHFRRQSGQEKSRDRRTTTLIDVEGKSIKKENNIDIINDLNKTRRTNKKSTKSDKNKQTGSIIFEIARVVIVAVVIAFLLNRFIITNALIPSGSMESTIMTGDRIIGLRTSYWFSDPQRGDIVIFKFPDNESKLYIKRIIGMPGDKVEIIEGKVFINGEKEALDEPYLNVTPKGSFGPYEVPEGYYFMMGDNRNVSVDSRYWDNTFVERSKILAKAWIKYYPGFKAIK